MDIRQIEKSDNPILADLIREVFEEHDAPRDGTVYSDPTTDDLYLLFESQESVLWVVEAGGDILGCCGVYPTESLPDKCAELVKFYLSKQARGKGLGRMLLEKSIESARELGYQKLYLESLPEFSNAVRMYEKLGFVRLDKPLGESGHTNCNIWMIKELGEE